MKTEERVLTALQGKQPDRVPVFIYLNPYSVNYDPSYADLMAACKEYADVIYDWPVNPFFQTAAPLAKEERVLANGQREQAIATPKGPLTSIRMPDWRGGGTVKRWISTPEDVEKVLSIPYEPYRPSDLEDFLRIRDSHRDRVVGQITLTDPLAEVAGNTDEEVLAVWTLEHRDLIVRFLDVMLERQLNHLRYYLDQGVGPLFYFNGPEYALPPLMAPADFDEFVVRYDRQLTDLIHSYPGRYVIVHSHGRVSRFLERFAEIGMDGLNVLEPPPHGDTILSDAKQRIGKQVCLIGNIQYDDIARGTEGSIERLVAEAMAQGAPGGGFILSPCAYPYEVPLPSLASKNLIHYLKKGRKYGHY